MTSPPPDYYAILGLEPNATPEEIKKRYRELARRYHPDVSASPDAAQKIKTVNQAYHVLGDPDRRGNYDAERILRQPSRPQPARRSAGSAPRPRSSAPPPAQAASGRPEWEFDGFGRKHRPSSSGSSSSASNRAAGAAATDGGARAASENPPRNSATEKAREDAARAQARQAQKAELETRIRILMASAMTAFDTRNYAEAESLCRQALVLDRSVAVAHEMLGDLYDRRGKREDASIAYSYAIQFNPRNYSAQGKLDRLTGRRPPPAVGKSASRAVTSTAFRPAGISLSREMTMGLLSVVVFLLFCGALAFYASNPGEPIEESLPWITAMSPNLLLTLICEGMVGGVLLGFYGRQRPLSEEMALPEAGAGGAYRPVSLIILLALFAFFWFYLSLLIYICYAVTRNRFSASTMRIYGLVFILTGLFTYMASQLDKGEGILTTAAFAGNLLFPAALFGWWLSDMVRLRGK